MKTETETKAKAQGRGDAGFMRFGDRERIVSRAATAIAADRRKSALEALGNPFFAIECGEDGFVKRESKTPLRSTLCWNDEPFAYHSEHWLVDFEAECGRTIRMVDFKGFAESNGDAGHWMTEWHEPEARDALSWLRNMFPVQMSGTLAELRDAEALSLFKVEQDGVVWNVDPAFKIHGFVVDKEEA